MSCLSTGGHGNYTSVYSEHDEFYEHVHAHALFSVLLRWVVVEFRAALLFWGIFMFGVVNT